MSLRVQINLLFISLVFAIGLGSWLFFNTQQQKLVETSLQEQANSISILISKDLAKLIYLDDTDSATDIVQRIKEIPVIYSATVFDKNNQPLLQVTDDKNIDDELKYTISSPVIFQGILLGDAHFIFHSSALVQQAQKLKITFLLLFAGMFFISILFAIYINEKFIKRLTQLNEALKETATTKQFSLRLNPQQRDEIGEAQHNFNNLISMIEEKTTRLTNLAYHDGLTGLFSREYLLNEITNSINSPANGFHAVCYIDLDQFKVINDTCGHQAGDRLLQQLAGCFKEFIAQTPDSTLGRIGGDAFIMLLKNRTKLKIDQTIKALHQRIRDLDFQFLERSFPIGASFGVIYFQNTSASAEDLLSAADAACYEAKNQGRNKVISLDMADHAQESYQQDMNLVSLIYEAIEKHQFQLYFQPIVSSDNDASSQYDHYETLLRLPDKQAEGRMISPELFIPVAERYGLAKQVDTWVVDNLFNALAQAPEFLEKIKVISVNLSIDSLTSDHMPDVIDGLFKKYGISPHKICFEITETGVSSSIQNAIKFIEHFKKQGSRFSLDDFGSGMSSFGYLAQLDVDYLKIDGSFVQYMENNAVNQEMVKAMTKIGHQLNKKLVAEYVETAETVALLKEIKVEFFQGYYFSQPKPIDSFINPKG